MHYRPFNFVTSSHVLPVHPLLIDFHWKWNFLRIPLFFAFRVFYMKVIRKLDLLLPGSSPCLFQSMKPFFLFPVAVMLLLAGLPGAVLAESDDTHLRRGEAFYAERKFNESLQEFNLADAATSASFDVVYARGKSLVELGRYREAIAEFTKALELKKVCARAHYHRGRSFAALKEFGRAEEDFNEAIGIRSSYDKAFFARGKVKFDLHEEAAALKDIRRASELGSTEAELWLQQHETVK